MVWQDKQFSWTHDGKSDDIPLESPYQKQLWSGSVFMFVNALLDENDFSKCGTHYHNKYINPWWADEMTVTTVIGDHKFLK